MKIIAPNKLAFRLRQYFTDHLPRVRGMSAHTVHSYRDSLVLFLRFLAGQRKCRVHDLDLGDIEPAHVIAFLAHLEEVRKNGVTTRNVRLAAIHAFFRYVGTCHPEQLDRVQRIQGIPFKRAHQRVIEYLERGEIEVILSRISRASPDGRRDYALLATMFNTGARVQEIVDLRARDLQLIRPFQIRLFGKGRKERYCPLWPQTAHVLRDHCEERHLDLGTDARVFLNHRQEPLTRFGVRYILAKHLDRVRADVSTLTRKRLHPHSMRHSTAVALLASGVDLTSISQWLGHSSLNTTNRYATIDLEMKRRAIAKVKPVAHRSTPSWRRNESVLEWLEDL
ncbi:MAG: tyrosine-type recombinase/integrase [Candidatus Sulfotelmatobacter sp.]